MTAAQAFLDSALHVCSRTAFLQADAALLDLTDRPVRSFTIKAADKQQRRGLANILLSRRYGWRGYMATALPVEQTADCITLCATEGDHPIGTITVRLDGPQGLQVENTFPGEVRQLRAAGKRLCEFTKLAVDPDQDSKRVLASLFHVAYLVAHRLRGYETLLIEVNPRHVVYYRRMLGCKVLTGERTNERVSAPAVLLLLDLTHTRSQIEKFGGQPELAAGERTLYPYAFSATEEASILERLESGSFPRMTTV